jgi:hypothetical protein
MKEASPFTSTIVVSLYGRSRNKYNFQGGGWERVLDQNKDPWEKERQGLLV